MSVERRPDGTTRGGNEPPDELQDTPEQNKGYDEAVRRGPISDQPERPHEADRDKTSLTDMPGERPGRRSRSDSRGGS